MLLSCRNILLFLMSQSLMKLFTNCISLFVLKTVENENFATGSYEIAKEISAKTKNSKLFSVIGGGDTVSVLNKLNLINNFNFVSTAGGAFLEYLEGKELPGIKSLN